MDMDDSTRTARAEISRRLKAARWLAGGINEKGQPSPLTPEALAEREPLRRNNITANAISEIERLVKDARPMELREIAEALELPADWFSREEPAAATRGTAALDELQRALVDLGLVPDPSEGEAPSGEDEAGPAGGAAEGGVA